MGDIVFIGGYTVGNGGAGEGISAASRDPDTGALTPLGVVATCDAPSFLAPHPRLPVLYAVHEVADGAVSAWAVGPEGERSGSARVRRRGAGMLGELRPLGGPRSTGGGHPCHVAVLPDGEHLVVANYGTGSVAVHPLDPSGAVLERTDLTVHDGQGPAQRPGAAGRDADRQDGAHAHMVSPAPDGGVEAVDLGTDAVYRYAVAGGRLRSAGEPLRTRPGAGPRHLARGRDGWRYVAMELDATVVAYPPDGAGEPTRVPASEAAGPNQPSEIALAPDGRHLYVANRGPDTIAVFEIVDGLPRYLTEVATGGRWPRHFALYDGFMYIANERSHSIVIFELAPSTGVPVATGALLDVPSPTCVLPGMSTLATP